jgi:hypothetical protein
MDRQNCAQAKQTIRIDKGAESSVPITIPWTVSDFQEITRMASSITDSDPKRTSPAEMDSNVVEASVDRDMTSSSIGTTAKESSRIISWGTTTGKLWFTDLHSEWSCATGIAKEDYQENDGSKGEEGSKGNE